MARICLKCAHENPVPGPEALAACPACGAIYSRVEEAVARKQSQASAKVAEIGPVRQALFFFLGVLAVGLLLTAVFAPADTQDNAPAAAVAAASAPPKARVVPAPVACPVDDAQCIGKRELSSAARPCQRAVELQLAYRHEWNDSWLEEKFDRVMWYEPPTTLAYHGRKLQAQNGFGAWKNLSYFCVWNIAGSRVMKAGINE